MNRLTILKIAAVVFAVLLVGGFVSYRAGAFDKYFSPPPPSPAPEQAPVATEDPAPSSVNDMDAIILSTSKSAGVLIPPPKKNPPESKPKQQILPGSKSMPVIPSKKDGL